MAESSNKRKRRERDGDDGPAGKRRASSQQLYCLANYMVTHKEFSSGRILATQGKATNEKQWGELSEILNGLPGPGKDPYEWKKCWTDLKCNVRGRAAKAKAVWAATGNNKIPPELPEIDMKVLNAIGIDACFGLQHEEYGFRPQDIQQDTNLLGLGSSGSSKISSPPTESQVMVQLLPSEIKSSDSCSPPLSPQTSDNSLLHKIPISISMASPDPLAFSPPPDPLASPNSPPIQTNSTASDEKSQLPPLSELPKISATLLKQSVPSSQPTLKSTAKKYTSLSSSLADATERLQRSQQMNSEELKAIHHAINRLAAASEASNEIQLQFLTVQRKFTSILEKAINHWINK